MASKNWDEMSAIEKDDHIALLTAKTRAQVAKDVNGMSLSERTQAAKAIGVSPVALLTTLTQAHCVILLNEAGIPWYSEADAAWGTKVLQVVARS